MGTLSDAKVDATMHEEEWAVRADLAAAYRLAAMHGWDDIVIAHLSARLPSCRTNYLMHAANLFFEEVTAENLHLLDENGKHVRPNPERTHEFAFPFHKAIYDAFPQANCIMHLHTHAATAVAMQKQGLIPGNQYALWLGQIGYHDYEGLISSVSEGQRLVQSFGRGHIVLQRAHGFVVWGRSIPHAYLLAYMLNRACEIQIASHTGTGGLPPYVPSPEVVEACVGQALASMLKWDGRVVAATWAAANRKLRKAEQSLVSGQAKHTLRS